MGLYKTFGFEEGAFSGRGMGVGVRNIAMDMGTYSVYCSECFVCINGFGIGLAGYFHSLGNISFVSTRIETFKPTAIEDIPLCS